MHNPVAAWSETIVIPTYAVGQPDKNPMFLEKRVYQGSSGAVYPHPVIDHIEDTRTDKAYTAVFLENRYLKIMLLPEIGGRVQMALDKTNGYHFVYYNQVIKPALVGLAGPWISGGIEFNWPQHHRPSTFDPMEWRIVENPDGSKTVWCSEIERMFHTKGMHGFTLHPDRACLEIRVQLYNRTSIPQTFLWWANPAVHVNDDYQSVFPPDVHAVMDHGKRAVSDFPIATGTYYKMNYAPGTDISRYKNIPVPTSYMAYHSDFDFVGDYDHGKRAGMLHIANHHLVPGKKQWTWGNSDFGKAWDRQLTDADGPYIELMCGAFTDNQPDFSWLMPGEEKSFTQTFLPYKQIGPAKNANEQVVLNLEVQQDQIFVGVYLSQARLVTILLNFQGQELLRKDLPLDPEHTFQEIVALPEGALPQDLALIVIEKGRILLSYSPLPEETPTIPDPATPARPPTEIDSNEELYLNGLHLEQYRHASYPPEPYYEEALRRDPLDSRCNNAMGLLMYRRGKFAEAEAYFRTALRSLTRRNPNPEDGGPAYNLGLALRMQGRFSEARNAFYKSTWNAAWQDSAYFELGRLAAREDDFTEAIALLSRCLSRNGTHHRARHLKAALLRNMGQPEAALREVAYSLAQDPLDLAALYEQDLLTGANTFSQFIRPDPNTYIELALDYFHAGLVQEGVALLEGCPVDEPLLHYYAGWGLLQSDDEPGARVQFLTAAQTQAGKAGSLFPNHLECVPALQMALRLNPQDAHAAFALGNFWYAHRRHSEAIEAWELSSVLDPGFPTTWRNLGLAYFNRLNDPHRALQAYENAFRLNPDDARVFYELDQLYRKLNRTPAERLAHLEHYSELVTRRDDLSIEYITLLNLAGRHTEAVQRLTTRIFHPWEGGEGKTTSQYGYSLVMLAREAILSSQPAKAISLLEQAQAYPTNLGEGKLAGAQENHIQYFLGIAHSQLGNPAAARAHFESAAMGLSEPTSAIYYNDQPPEMIFYQGLARRALGREAEAQAIFQKLLTYGQDNLAAKVQIDYFAVSLPDFLVFKEDLGQRNRAHCHFMMALGCLGLGDLAEAETHFQALQALDSSHAAAAAHRQFNFCNPPRIQA